MSETLQSVYLVQGATFCGINIHKLSKFLLVGYQNRYNRVGRFLALSVLPLKKTLYIYMRYYGAGRYQDPVFQHVITF